MITMRELPPREWSRLKQIFHNYGCHVPDNGHIVVLEEGKRIVGFQCLHRVWHAGPAWIAPEYRGQGLWQHMQRKVEGLLEHDDFYYQFGTKENESALVRFGLLPMGWTVWGKRVNHPVTVRGVKVGTR